MRRTRAATGQVTGFELFFDLVFVFVITQATHVVEVHPDLPGLGHALLPLALVSWMYLAFGWLTNAVRPDSVGTRMLLTVAMVAFFVIGLDLPFAFDPAGVAFPIAYLVVVAIHTTLYLTSGEPGNRRGILRIAPTNAAAGVMVLVAEFVPEPWSWALWLLAIVGLYSSLVLGRVRGFVVEPHHFVERHGLIILLVVGESIVAIGIGAAGQPVDAVLVAGVTLGIALATAIWWIYFDGDEERATDALVAASPERRQNIAFNAFSLGHVSTTMGIVIVAAGIADAIHHFAEHASPWLLGVGAAVFLLGHAAHRAALGTGRLVDRLVGALAVAAGGLLAAFGGWVGLVVVTLVLAVVAALDHRLVTTAGTRNGVR